MGRVYTPPPIIALRDLATDIDATGIGFNADLLDDKQAADFMWLTTAQTVAGVKTFSSIPIGPASDPTADNELARKKYIDDNFGAGDVTGAASSTDNAITRFNGTGGKTIQDYTSNPPTVSDTGDIDVDGNVTADNVVVAADIQHEGDVNTKVAFTADNISLETGGNAQLVLSNSGVQIQGAGVIATGILDEDNMVSNSAVKLCSQQSIKAYADTKGSGDVTGPGSSVDHAIARFHQTSGKVIQDYTSNAPTISDTGDVTIDGDVTADNVVCAGNVDGRNVSADGSKLDGIAAGADVTGSNAPQAHKTSHQNGGGDEISVAGLSGLLADDQHVLDAEVVTAAKTVKLDDFAACDDNTDLNCSTSAHGLLKKLDNAATNFMNGQGNWSVPAGGITIATGTYAGDDTTNREINIGFQPDFVVVIATSNPPATTPTLCFANSTVAPFTYAGIDYFAEGTAYWQGPSANGFTCGDNATYTVNQTGETYMYFAIAD